VSDQYPDVVFDPRKLHGAYPSANPLSILTSSALETDQNCGTTSRTRTCDRRERQRRNSPQSATTQWDENQTIETCETPTRVDVVGAEGLEPPTSSL